jgi:hypothetical protein
MIAQPKQPKPSIDCAKEASGIWCSGKAAVAGLCAASDLGLGAARFARAGADHGHVGLQAAFGLICLMVSLRNGLPGRAYLRASRGGGPASDESDWGWFGRAAGFVLEFVGVQFILVAGGLVLVIVAVTGGRW